MRFSPRSTFTLLLSLCACATGTELGNSSGGTGTLASSSAGGSSSNGSSSGDTGGSAGAGGSNTAGMGGAGGDAGASGSSSSGGMAGAGGDAGAGGSSSSGGMGGTGGMGMGGAGGMGGAMGGAGGMGGGMGGAGGAGGMGGGGGAGGMGGAGGAGGMGGSPTGSLVAMAGPSAGGVVFESGAGWTSAAFNFSWLAGSISPRMAGGALAVLRQSNNDELYWTTWSKAGGFSAAQKVSTFGFTKDPPSTAPAGVASILTIRGTDGKHYYAQNDDGNSFGAFGNIPAGNVMIQAFGPSAPAVTSDGTAGVYAVYAGADERLYYTYKPSAGGAWGPSTQIPTSTVINTIRPFAFSDAAMDLRVFYIRKGDNRICMVKLMTPQNSWTSEETIATATSALTPAATEISPGGDIVVVYHGLITNGIYFVRGKDGAFTNISTVEDPMTTTSEPVITRGLSGADAEILYAGAGKLRHARVVGNAATPADVLNLTGVTHVTATNVP